MAKRASLKRLSFCNFKLDTLLEITLTINENLPTEELLKKYEKLLTDKLNIGKLIIFAYNQSQWEILLTSGIDPLDFKDVDIEKDLLPIDEITTVTASGLMHLMPFDTIIPVFHNNSALAYVLIGDIDEEREGVSPTIKHLRFIQTLTNIIIVAMENKRLQEEMLRQEAIKKELELASRMQEMLIPKKELLPKNDVIFVESFYLPHFDVGGDYYDFFSLNNTEFAFCMADVSGKGISAAILMSNFQANLRALFTDAIELSDLVRKLNTRVMESANGEKFITLFIGKYNTENHELKYINAGHNPPLFYDKKQKKLSHLDLGCPGMGMLDEIPVVNEGSVKIEHNTKLLAYTDGLVELKGENTTDAGMEALARIFTDNTCIDTSIQNIIENMEISRTNEMFFDDISMLGIEFF